MNAQRLADYAPVFAALGDATRLRLVAHLSQRGPQSISRLAQGEAVTRQAVTKHLAALEHAGLVASSRQGRERVWEIRAARLAHAQRALAEISSQWDGAIERLRRFVES